MADQEAKAAGQNEYACEGASIGSRIVRGLVGRFGKSWFIEYPGRQTLDISGQSFTRKISQKIKRRAWLVRAPLDNKTQSANTALRILFGEAIGLGGDRLLGFIVDKRSDLKGDDAQHHSGAKRADRQKGERQLESCRAKELTERHHAAYNPRRAPYEEGADQSPCRSWRAASRRARQ